MSKLAYDLPVISIDNSTQDQSAARGRFVQTSGALITHASNQVPLGVLVDGGVASARSAIAPCGSGALVKVKLHSTPGTVAVGTYLCLHSDGSVLADAGTGARVRVARALEAGAASELITAVLLDPTVFAS